MSDQEIGEAIKEIRETETTGIIPDDGVIKKYARLTGEITGGFTVTDYFMTQINILKEAAYRVWL